MKMVFLGLLLWTFVPSMAQNKLKTISVSDTILCAAIDRPGDFYAVTKTGQIQKFDKNGKLIILYKYDEVPTIFDPRDGSRLFAYYRENQHYEFRNPSFELTASLGIDSAFAIQPWLICPSGEYKLWVLDNADNSLKKINVRASEVEVEVFVDPAIIENARSFKTMREYQNFVFLLNPEKGIFIFNSLGKHIKTIDVPGIQHFNFLGEELYFLVKDKLKFFNLFTAEIHEMTIDPKYENALLSDERLILFMPQSIDIFQFRP